MDINATILTPADVDATGDQTPFALEQCERRYLAQGDSWFSIGAFPPGLTSNILLAPLVLSRSTAIVNCAKPGAVLRNMVDHVREAQFAKFLKLGGYNWDALLISGGGNDFIDFAGRGMEEDKALRLFLTPQERGSDPLAPAGYVSEEGWTHFSGMLREAFRTLFNMQDGGNSPNAPVVCHTYAYLTPRPSPAGPGIGPWLKSALDNYKVPTGKELRLALISLLLDRLAALLRDIAAKRMVSKPGSRVEVIDTLKSGLAIADGDATGPSGDFQNEIHPTKQGYQLLAKAWRSTLDALPQPGFSGKTAPSPPVVRAATASAKRARKARNEAEGG